MGFFPIYQLIDYCTTSLLSYICTIPKNLSGELERNGVSVTHSERDVLC